MSLSDWRCEACGVSLQGAGYALRSAREYFREVDRKNLGTLELKETDFVPVRLLCWECSLNEPMPARNRLPTYVSSS